MSVGPSQNPSPLDLTGALSGFRRFVLLRHADVSGVSGEGLVVYGVRFPDGTVAYRWNTPRATTCIASSVEDVVAIHGHNGATRMVWINDGYETDIATQEIARSGRG